MIVTFWHFCSDDNLSNIELHIVKLDLYSTSLENLKYSFQFREPVIDRLIGKLGPSQA
jgi:hypothetical protein